MTHTAVSAKQLVVSRANIGERQVTVGRRRRRKHDPRWDFENRVEWCVSLGLKCGATTQVIVMAPPDATDVELLSCAVSKLKRQQEEED